MVKAEIPDTYCYTEELLDNGLNVILWVYHFLGNNQ